MLIRIPRRPPSIRYAFKSRQPYTTVFSPKKYRQIDHKAFEDMKTVLLYILRPGTSGEYGFGNRDDGYVSVKQLLNHPEFKSLDIIKLQYIVNTDKKHRFDLEFDPTKGADSYWLRAKQWNEVHWVMKPVLPKDHPGTPVYSTTLEQWHGHIARNGIPRGRSDWIEISRNIFTAEYLLTLEDNHEVFIFLNLSKCMEAGLRFFSPTPTAQKWTSGTPLITKGDSTGYILPSLFSRVEFVSTKKNVLWGDSKPINHQGWVGFDEWDFTPDGQRKTYLQSPKGITGFTMMASETTTGLRLEDVPGLKAEAMAILQS